ncbi:alpha/beta hydrolase [Litorimonas sp. WD9-15]|uniref:alpha/beta hydrolase n=1 Tax=Litorimonas sp. WD9-15 TaxID=3418716 RepID=UPI003D08EFE3
MSYLLALLVLILVLFTYLYLRSRKLAGADLSEFDREVAPFAVAKPSKALDDLNQYIREMFGGPGVSATARSGWEAKRERFDTAGLARTDLKAEYRPAEIDVDGNTMTGSWTLVEGYDPDKRILYMHGGAFTVGSDISHRPLSVALAKRTKAAVFVPNYRLMPENSRRDTITDSRVAYDWVLENGPDGPAKAKSLALGGDSAGGNLALMLSNWSRENAARKPDAVIAFSPGVDGTLSSPSLKSNLETDLMLKPLLGKLMKIPRIILLPAMKRHSGMNPADPDQSPIFDDLSNLPPTLILAAQEEVLYDDGARYTAKMEAAGSSATFQNWAGGLPHVWPIFDDKIPEANQALDGVGDFLNAHLNG